jgi:hypothetical protein
MDVLDHQYASGRADVTEFDLSSESVTAAAAKEN